MLNQKLMEQRVRDTQFLLSDMEVGRFDVHGFMTLADHGAVFITSGYVFRIKKLFLKITSTRGDFVMTTENLAGKFIMRHNSDDPYRGNEFVYISEENCSVFHTLDTTLKCEFYCFFQSIKDDKRCSCCKAIYDINEAKEFDFRAFTIEAQGANTRIWDYELTKLLQTNPPKVEVKY